MSRVRPFVYGVLILSTGVLISTTQPDLTHANQTSSLQTQIDAHTQAVNQLNAEIAQYEAKIKQAGADKATLQNAINTLELQKRKVQTQINATQTQIDSTHLQIQQITTQIASIENAISANQAALASDLRSVQQSDAQPLITQLFSSGSLANAWTDVDSLAQVNRAIQEDSNKLASQQDALTASRVVSKQKQVALTSQQHTLTSQKTSLLQTANQKTRLLKETSASEVKYQKLLAQARAELSSFSTFAQNAGGSGLLTNQTSCDSWGCYYNQRDAQWGNDSLNGTKYTLKSDGCLVTSMAMVMTHYGYKDVTPVTINSNPANFAAYYPAYMLATIQVDGMTVTRKLSYLNKVLNSGNPAIVGVYAYGGTHYVVITKRAGGKYIMRDPYAANGKDIPFSSHYLLRKIFSVAKVTIS